MKPLKSNSSPGVGASACNQAVATPYTFLIGFALSLCALVTSLVLHGKFMALGGPDHYVAPEQDALVH